MALLSEEDRSAVWAEFMTDSAVGTFGELTKQDLKQAVGEVDEHLETAAAALVANIEAALSEPAKSALTTVQKSLLLMYVFRKRNVPGV